MNRRALILASALLASVATLTLAVIVYLGSGKRGGGIPSWALTVMQSADHYELFSLDPEPPELKRERTDDVDSEKFHGWIVMGRTVIDSEATRKILNEALDTGAKETGLGAAACFNPRHGIRMNRGHETVDFVICFQCSHVEIYQRDEKLRGFFVTSSPQPAFDGVLREAGVPLAKDLY
jgi:hypothetical protein